MKKLVVLSGAGISAESGVKTFRDEGGLWEGHDVMQVASLQGFQQNPELVLKFYNKRRKQLKEVEPNQAHIAIANLENQFDVHIITQNVDNLHERAGSKKVLHLHGQLLEARPVDNETTIIKWTEDLNLGDVDDRGIQLRPNVVWFGESVPNIKPATAIISQADILLIIGTSLQVYPAAGLIEFAPQDCAFTLIDPKPMSYQSKHQIRHIQTIASRGMQIFIDRLNNLH